MRKMMDLTGRRYGKLTVVRFLEKRNDNHKLWLCKCDCGNEKAITTNRLNCRYEPTKSCGCLQKEIAHSKAKHGMSTTSTYKVWTAMRQRCLNSKHPEYHNYGGRGITVDPRWERFEQFLHDMGEAPKGMTLGRIDNNNGYSRDNCRWENYAQQAINKRNTVHIAMEGVSKPLKTWCIELGLTYRAALARYRAGDSPERVLQKTKPHNNYLTYRGETKTFKEWARLYGINRTTLIYRIKHGWGIEEALNTPLCRNQYK